MKFEQKFSIWIRPAKQKESEDGLMPIYVRITVDGRRAEYSTAKFIEEKYWDSSRERVKTFHPRADVINEELSKIYSDLSRCFLHLIKVKDWVSPADVKNMFLNGAPNLPATIPSSQSSTSLRIVQPTIGLLPVEPVVQKTFMSHFTEYIKIARQKRDNGSMVDGRFRRFQVLYNKVEAYLHHRYNIDDVLPSEMKLSFIVGFEHFMRTVQQIGHNTAMKCCKDLKQVMEYVRIEEDMPMNRLSSFKCTYKKVKRKYLDGDELAAIEDKLIAIPRLDEVRDCFIFCCYTGYAYSDAAALSNQNVAKGIDGSLWVIRDRGKTGEVENVPLLPKALAIIEKYKDHPYCKKYNKLLPMNSNVRYNAYLKELGTICGIQRDLTTHMARHTCATTVLLTNDVPIETVKEFLGHSDIRTTQIYAKVVQKKLSNDLNDLKRKLENRN